MVARASLFSVLLSALCLSQMVLAGEPAAIPPATTEQIHQTVDRALVYIKAESDSWLKTRQCAACHHAPITLWALGEAERQGYAIDKKFLVDTIESLLGSKEKL